MEGKKVIVRGENSGVFFGTLDSQNGQKVVLKNARNLWYWEGAASIMQIAAEGVETPSECKFTVVVSSLMLLDAIEIIPCTDEAVANIECVGTWRI